LIITHTALFLTTTEDTHFQLFGDEYGVQCHVMDADGPPTAAQATQNSAFSDTLEECKFDVR